MTYKVRFPIKTFFGVDDDHLLIFMKALQLFLAGTVMEARMQRWFISHILFDLCIDTGAIKILIKGEDD